MIEKLPMDNLYKFMVILGIIMMVLPFTLYPIIQKYDVKIIEVNTYISELNTENTTIKKQGDALVAKNSELMKSLATLETDIAKFEGLKKWAVEEEKKYEEFKKLWGKEKLEKQNIEIEIQSIQSKISEFEDKIAIVKKEGALLEAGLKEQVSMRLVASWFPWLGFGISILGIFYWYNKTQKHLDKIIEKEAQRT